ncbi:MAG TPA: HAD hydrolase-like protein [Gemmatimonadaceae bacterium]|nr:HAD hydrolase-like protein [Gemmatimonadaceae bacterium]
MTLPLILIEFDDVLAETHAPRSAALRDALAAEGVELTGDVYDTACSGLSFAGAARAAIRLANLSGRATDETAIELAALRATRTFGEAVARGIPLMRGAVEFVRSAAGLARLGIVTRSPRRDVELTLSFSGLEDAFECAVTAEDYTGPEPASAPFDAAFVRMSEGRAVRVGGNIALVASLNGVAAARAARLSTIVVGALSPTVAFAGDGYLPTLERTTVRDVLRIGAAAEAR